MVHSEGNFVSTDGLTIYHQAWLPGGAPKAVVILLHGLAEHSGRYVRMAEALTDAGYAVHALDHRGHGRSDGKRTYVKSYADYQRDIAHFRRLVEQQHPGLPLFVLGHSMGGNLALGHVLDHQAGVRGLVLSAPALAPGASLSPTKIRLARLVGRIAPGLPAEALSAEAISRDPAVVAAYRADPLVFNGKITAGVAAALLGSMEAFPPRYAELELPVLLQHGTADALVAIAGTRELETALVNAKVTTHYYDGLYHEIFNEAEQATVIADTIAWLDSVAGG
ncbi:MAG TPA: alpha/beta hydrolase [Ilumatobacter sp.]|nr:alpha/beta hydrolase [Ilumatobacter sp.]